tara:strand:+ start:2151 stop:3188 length:1038 start_codon:yes stop_codon:yes gene_type:complete
LNLIDSINKPQIISISDLEIEDVETFLRKEYPKNKGDFILKHGEWLHLGNENRFFLVVNKKIIGYCGIIPTTIVRNKKKIKAIWWIDLIITKEFRGNGYQSIFDDYIRNRPEIKLGFPNKNAAKIHKSHGWEVRNDLKVMLLLIEPKNFLLSKIKKSVVLFRIINYFSFLILNHKSDYKSKWSIKKTNLNINKYIEICSYARKDIFTTFRDEKYFINRYVNSPFFNQYDFYHCEKNENVKAYLIARRVQNKKGLIVRIVDLFGSIWDRETVKDLINTLIQDSIIRNVSQIQILESDPKLQKILILLGFILFKKARFCSYDNKNDGLNLRTPIRWVFADSDSDFLD